MNKSTDSQLSTFISPEKKSSPRPLIFKKPHLVTDINDKVVSCYYSEKLQDTKPIELKNLSDKKIGILRCLPNDEADFLSFFKLDDENLNEVQETWNSKANQIINKDLEAILYSSAKSDRNIDDLLYRCCLYIRSHILVENCCIYGLPDGHSLVGLVGVTQDGKKDQNSNWDYTSMNLATIAIQQKKPYVCQNPAQDSNFQKSDSDYETRNLVCFPVLNEGNSVGLIILSNKIGGSFEDHDLRVIQKFSTAISHLLKEEFEENKRETLLKTSDNLGKYLSKNIVRKIALTGTHGGLGGITKRVIVLFSDIRSFSTITQGISAPTLVNLLNFYFEEMSVVIEKYHGTLDKLVGDLMMVVWNIPNDHPDAEVLAVKAAIDMQKAVVKTVAPKWKESGVQNFGVGIGINAGEAVVGNMGSKSFMNYTVIGNCINTAQRLESKARAGEVWVHEEMMPFIEGKVPQPVRKEFKIKLKGISEPVDAYVFKVQI